MKDTQKTDKNKRRLINQRPEVVKLIVFVPLELTLPCPKKIQ